MVKTKTHRPTSSFCLRCSGASFPNRRIMVWRAITFLIPGRRASTTSLGNNNMAKI